MTREYRRPTRSRQSSTVPEQAGPLAMPIWVFLLVWLACAIVAAFSWDNLITNTQGAADFSLTARVVLAVSFGLPGAGLVSFVVGIFRDQSAANT